MTSRRSRLKAVANLPVRRKPISSQGSTEETVSDSPSAEKNPLSNLKNDDLVTPKNNSCQNYDASTSVPSKILQLRDNEDNQDVIGSDKNETLSDNISENPALTGVFPDKSNDYVINLLENNNEISGSCNVNKNGSNCENLLFKCDNNSEFDSPLSGEKSQWQIPEKGLENHIFQKTSLPTSSVNDIATSNIIEDGVKCYTVLSSESITDPSMTTITTFTSCVSGDVDTLTEINAQDICQNLEVQIFTELVPATEGYNNVPEFVTSENTEFIIQNDQLEHSLTNLDNCNTEREVEDISCNFDDNNKTHLKNMVQNTTPKPSGKVGAGFITTNEGFSGNSVTVLGDKTMLGNLTTSVLQNSTSESDPISIPLKKGISTIKRKRSKGNDFTKKLADARREFQKKYEKTKPDRSTLKMIDLIFYNPASNPMESKSKFEKKEASLLQGEFIQEILAEERVDEPESTMDSDYGKTSDNKESDKMSRMPVPQVKIGLNGEIILDEKSLVIETTDARKGREDLQNSVPVFEDRGSKISYYRGKTKKTRDWTDFETKRFYKALNTIGPDFSLMQKYFPKRSRLELKNKFKREERLNRNLIDKALNNPAEFDMTQLEKDLAVEKRAEEEEIEMRLYKGSKEKIAPRKARIKSSFLSRQMIESDGETENNQSKLDSVNSKRILQSEKEKKKKEISVLFQKILLKGSENEISEFEGVSESSLDVFTSANDGVT